MTCRKGDLAFVRGCKWTKELNDRIVIVVREAQESEWTYAPIADRNHGGMVWICKSAAGGMLPLREVSGEMVECEERPIGDRFLRPIRDPGEDAKDETLQWLPVPSQHKEAA